MTKLVQMVPGDSLEKAAELWGFAIDNGWSEEDLYYVVKILLSLFKED